MSTLRSAAPAIVVGASNLATSGAFTVGLGDTIIALGWGLTGAGARGVTDSLGNTYVTAVSLGLNGSQISTPNTVVQTEFVCEGATHAGSCQAIYSDANDNAPHFHAAAFKNTKPSGGTYRATGVSDGATNPLPCSVTTTGSNETLYAFLFDDRTLDSLPTTGFTILCSLNDAQGWFVAATKDAPTPGAYDPNWSGIAAGRNDMAWTVAMQDIGGGASVPAPMPFTRTQFFASDQITQT